MRFAHSERSAAGEWLKPQQLELGTAFAEAALAWNLLAPRQTVQMRGGKRVKSRTYAFIGLLLLSRQIEAPTSPVTEQPLPDDSTPDLLPQTSSARGWVQTELLLGDADTPDPGVSESALPRQTHEDERDAPGLIPGIKSVFADEGVPPQLVWIAEVESSLDPNAVSPSGAVGLFQFMPRTAACYGLRTQRRDDRVVPEPSARAAARYLRYLHGQFGSWPLAVAAYNAGETRVRRLMRRSGASSFDSLASHLPSQTRRYVPKVMHAIARREGTALESLPPPGGIREG